MQLRTVLTIILMAVGTTLAVLGGLVVPAPAGPQPPAPPLAYYDPLPR